MESTASQNETVLTLKSLQSHLIKAIMGALIVAMLTALGTSVIFYFNTSSNVKELNDYKTETKQDIKELKVDVADIKTTLSNTSIYTQENKDKAKNLENEVADMRRQQDEMLKLLYEIKAKVK